MIYVFLATGFEDIEALAPVDIMRRAGLSVETVSITESEIVESAHAVAHALKIVPDMNPTDSVIICLSGRGDKDVAAIARYRGHDIHE